MNYGRSELSIRPAIDLYIVKDTSSDDSVSIRWILDLSLQKIKFASQGLSQSTYCIEIR